MFCDAYYVAGYIDTGYFEGDSVPCGNSSSVTIKCKAVVGVKALADTTTTANITSTTEMINIAEKASIANMLCKSILDVSVAQLGTSNIASSSDLMAIASSNIPPDLFPWIDMVNGCCIDLKNRVSSLEAENDYLKNTDIEKLFTGREVHYEL